MTTYKNRSETLFIVVHCAATPPSLDVDAKMIDRWHRAKGWNGLGYARVIKRDGTIEQGRPDNAVGAHVEGFNTSSVGICLAGGVAADGKTPENNFTPDQFMSLLVVLKELTEAYPKAEVQGHRDFPGVKKACPSFDVKTWWATFK